MSDICCRRCGEPTDVFTVYHEMDEAERTKFLHGEGCWYCQWGAKCPTCNGRGTRIEFRYTAQFGERRHVHTDEPCSACAGTGTPTLTDEGYGHALSSLMNTDEDPTLYL